MGASECSTVHVVRQNAKLIASLHVCMNTENTLTHPYEGLRTSLIGRIKSLRFGENNQKPASTDDKSGLHFGTSLGTLR